VPTTAVYPHHAERRAVGLASDMRDPLEPTRRARGGRQDPNGPYARLGHGRMGPQHGAPPQLGPNRVFRRFGDTYEILGVRAPPDPPMTGGLAMAIYPMRGAPNTPWAFDRPLKGVVEGWVCVALLNLLLTS